MCVEIHGFVLGGAETLLDTAIQDMGGRAEKEDACAGEHVSANLADEVLKHNFPLPYVKLNILCTTVVDSNIKKLTDAFNGYFETPCN